MQSTQELYITCGKNSVNNGDGALVAMSRRLKDGSVECRVYEFLLCPWFKRALVNLPESTKYLRVDRSRNADYYVLDVECALCVIDIIERWSSKRIK